jgi:hypothetical protein
VGRENKSSAISPVFKLYLIKEFQRLKEEEPTSNYRENLQWLPYAEEADFITLKCDV